MLTTVSISVRPGLESTPEARRLTLDTPHVHAGEPDFSKKHPLETKWTLWFDNPNGKQKQATWGQTLRAVYTFDTVEDFWWCVGQEGYPSLALCPLHAWAPPLDTALLTPPSLRIPPSASPARVQPLQQHHPPQPPVPRLRPAPLPRGRGAQVGGPAV